jgi:arginine exporter protein ArgO
MTTMNPLTVVYFTALVLGRQAAAAPGRADQAVFVVAVFVASASWQLVLAGGGAFLGRCYRAWPQAVRVDCVRDQSFARFLEARMIWVTV